MPLQVRLRHALGERVLELPERGVSQPLVIGRGAGADLQVPSATVASQHCALFLHEDRWVVQAMSGPTTLNGDALSKPAALRIGDVIGLGTGPAAPTLEVDPIGVSEGRTGPAGAPKPAAPRAAAPARPAAPAAGGPRPAPAPARAPAPAPAPAPARVPRFDAPPPQPVLTQKTPEQQPGWEDEEIIDWSVPTEGPADDAKPRPRRKQSTSPVAVIAVIVLGMAGLVGIGAYVYNTTHRPPPAVQTVAQLPPIVKLAPVKSKGLFDLNADQELARRRHAPQPAAMPSPAAPESPVASDNANSGATPAASQLPAGVSDTTDVTDAAMASDDGPKGDPVWDEIRNAHLNARHQGLAILKFDEYRRDNPGKYTELLDRYTDAAINWLYWQRVAQLWSLQENLMQQIHQKDVDLHNQPPGDFHNQLAKDRGDLQTKFDDTKSILRDEMGYTGDDPPNLESPGQLRRLAEKRDPDKFAGFRKHVLKYVRDNHGGTWWDGQ